MKILVLGAGGVGSAFAPIAARRDFFEHIVFADNDEGRARRVVDRSNPDVSQVRQYGADRTGEQWRAARPGSE